MPKLHYSLTGLALLGLLACSGGGGGNSNAKALAYANPSGATDDYRFVVSSGNNTNTITLELRGPESTTTRGRGINFSLSADSSKARFRQLDGSEYAKPIELDNGGVFDLGRTSPRLFKAVLDGDNLHVSMAQKGNSVPANTLNGVIATVSLQLQSGAAKGNIRLEPLEARVLLDNGSIVPVDVKVGVLTAQ